MVKEMGKLKILVENRGIEWDNDAPSSIENAKRIFDEKIRQGWLANKEKKGSKEVTYHFDPEADEITMAPPVTGGRRIGKGR